MSPALTKKQRKQIYENMAKSKLAKMKFTLEDIKEINPVRKLIITDQHLISLRDVRANIFCSIDFLHSFATGHRMSKILNPCKVIAMAICPITVNCTT